MGERLWAWRAASALTQEEAAKRLGVHQVTYCDWENGRKIPRLKHRTSVERVTGVPADAWPKPRRRRKARQVSKVNCKVAAPLAASVRPNRTSLSR